MGKNFRETLNEQLAFDDDFKKEYDSLNAQYNVIKSLIYARKSKNLTQKGLSELTGINQSDISKIERGNVSPNLRTLQRIATAMNMDLKIDFVQK
ncbi:MAG: helix-turn-helix domain-containing protein [Ruminococcus sp.]|nr:helix-turn-helix domain-containing protein [Ruminococcus sp.]